MQFVAEFDWRLRRVETGVRYKLEVTALCVNPRGNLPPRGYPGQKWWVPNWITDREPRLMRLPATRLSQPREAVLCLQPPRQISPSTPHRASTTLNKPSLPSQVHHMVLYIYCLCTFHFSFFPSFFLADQRFYSKLKYISLLKSLLIMSFPQTCLALEATVFVWQHYFQYIHC